jgi:hypothetical protein
VAAGWSFGAEVMLGTEHPAISAWFAMAPPLAGAGHRPPAGSDDRPCVLAVPEHDQFCPPHRARALTGGWQATTVEVVAGADHSLVGRAGALAARLVALRAAL